jgi:hypothetical protein
MFAADDGLNVSVPRYIPEMYTNPGIKDLVIWMNDTDKYKYAEFDNHKLAAYKIPMGITLLM